MPLIRARTAASSLLVEGTGTRPHQNEKKLSRIPRGKKRRPGEDRNQRGAKACPVDPRRTLGGSYRWLDEEGDSAIGPRRLVKYVTGIFLFKDAYGDGALFFCSG